MKFRVLSGTSTTSERTVSTALVSFDVTSFYTNIFLDLRMEDVNISLNKHTSLLHQRFTSDRVLEGIRLVLENNMFDDGNITGTIKRTAKLATLIMGYIEEQLYMI